MKEGYQIRAMGPEEMDLAIEWAAAEGWNPGLYDGPVFHATDPGGFFLGLLDGEPVACISTVAYSRTFGFLGFYIVRPGFRGRGLGLEIWKRGMAYLGSRNVGLDGVPAQVDNYRKSGFVFAYSNIRYEGVAEGRTDAKGQAIRAPGANDLIDVARLDRRVFPAPRRDFLKRWLALPESHALAVYNGEALTGYGVIRRCRTGYKIGPLTANNESAAAALFDELLTRVERGAAIFLDVPEGNRFAVRLAERNGMTPVFETARMYNKGEPKLRLDKVYGVTTFELG
jgi:ribosomal protein S18 acetylase RimI-like enzyme